MTTTERLSAIITGTAIPYVRARSAAISRARSAALALHDVAHDPATSADLALGLTLALVLGYRILGGDSSEETIRDFWARVADLESVAHMPPSGDPTRLSAINTRQAIRANVGDETAFIVASDGGRRSLLPQPARQA